MCIKVLIFVLLLTTALVTTAQVKTPLFKFKPFDEELNKIKIPKYLKTFGDKPHARFPHLLKQGIVVLQLDNMPCLVPDTKEFNMPVYEPITGTHTIPIKKTPVTDAT